MQDISKNQNPANQQKAKKLYETLCEMAENSVNKSVALYQEPYTYVLDFSDKEGVLKVANDKKEKTHLKPENLINILSQFNDLEREHLLKQAEKSVIDAQNNIISDYQAYVDSCDYIEPVTTVITDPEIGREFIKSVERNELEQTREALINEERVQGEVYRKEDAKHKEESLADKLFGYEEQTHKEALENPMTEQERAQYEQEVEEETSLHRKQRF